MVEGWVEATATGTVAGAAAGGAPGAGSEPGFCATAAQQVRRIAERQEKARFINVLNSPAVEAGHREIIILLTQQTLKRSGKTR
jgi:hypothetical protein